MPTQSKKTVVRVRKNTAKPRRVSKKRKKAQPKSIPAWLKYFLAALVVVFLIVGFYFFFIRPYAYRWKPCYGYKGYGVCIPSGYPVHGLDLSHYQGTINWLELVAFQDQKFPLNFVIMKATEGGDHCDTTFVRNFEAAKDYGFIRGVYHFFSPRTDALKQAEFFIETVKLKEGDLPPVLDIELAGKNSVEELQHKAKLWLDRVEQHYGVKPIIYASYKFKMKYLNDAIFDAYPYWIAHYYVDSVRYKGKWDFWQHTDAGNLPGIKDRVDLNVFNGSCEQLKQLTLPKQK
ncbi:glycoside hydrolase family 25 protein [Bacteroides sp. 214]|uniref:glycoside hydrolase family 25 protein n=1 Tax=Bacteroides sp. 214 TaxID=2302935 RepID=UPI0013D5D308|nr:glycoside hydrolase family 25 protein [Bacteroides sp. 214]NDW11299.1 glycoside hydrolase family 25 protein [Bacteroides sp. 214]